MDGWATLESGEYRSSDLQTNGVPLNGIIGIKIEGDMRCQIELHDSDNFKGESRVWTKGLTRFKDGKCHNGPNDKADFGGRAESVKIRLGKRYSSGAYYMFCHREFSRVLICSY